MITTRIGETLVYVTNAQLPIGSEGDLRAKFQQKGVFSAVAEVVGEVADKTIYLGDASKGEIEIIGIDSIEANIFFLNINYRVKFPAKPGKPPVEGVYRALRWNVGIDSGAACLCITKDKRVVLVRNFRHAKRAFCLEIPRGLRKPGETVENCGLRESLQEAGVRSTAETEAVDLGVHDPDTGLLMQTPHLFVYTNVEVDPGKVRQDRTEAISGAFAVSVAELEDMIRKGEVTDGYTVAAFMRARLAGLL